MTQWIGIKEKPPNNLLVEVKGSDIRGTFTMQAKYVYYKGKHIGRWMYLEYGNWYRYPHQGDIEQWRAIAYEQPKVSE